MGHTKFLVKVQDPTSSPKCSRRLPANTLNISYMTKVTQNKIITHMNFLGKQLLWPTLILNMKINVDSRKKQWPTIIRLYSVTIIHILIFVLQSLNNIVLNSDKN